MIGSLSNGKFVEKKRFYVNNSAGYEQPQDIFYHSKYGLFVVTNKKQTVHSLSTICFSAPKFLMN